MKFESITMKNFMRFKGLNRIDFSCEECKNTTVVLGDNTVGKTTIAQAFRWGLYGCLLVEKGKRQEDYVLLNNEVIEWMDSNSRAEVSVELVILNEQRRYRLFREITYIRKLPQTIVSETARKLTLGIGSLKSTKADEIKVEEKKIPEVINELFPKDLSHYFLFDGERWNDISIGGMKENIKESVHKLTGLSAVKNAMLHLKDIGRNSVITKFKGNISGSGAIFDNLKEDAKREERKIEHLAEQINAIEINIENYSKMIQEIEEYLLTNQATEQLQNNYQQLKLLLNAKAKSLEKSYRILVDDFSSSAYKAIAEPMLYEAMEKLKEVRFERRDIPHMRQATIDFLLERGECICGTCIKKESPEYQRLMEQRNFLPPADIGSLLGEFERTANRWRTANPDFLSRIREEALAVKNDRIEYEQTGNDLVKLGNVLDSHHDFSEKRQKLSEYKRKINQLGIEKGRCAGQIENCRQHLERLEREMFSLEARTQENMLWRERVELAQKLYERLKRDFEDKERKIFLELNQRIQENFQRMFNAKDKKIELDERYHINMLYRNKEAYQIENNLSEGEKIARNFAFIVTIMEYARNRKAEGDKETEPLPIVLDGPFSKLGEENIGLTARVLPQIAEQVIIFMLKKDWKYTGLEEFVGGCYEIEKEYGESSSFIQRKEVIKESRTLV